MRGAVVGSRGACGIDIGKFLPDDCHEIVSGGAKGVDRVAASYAVARGIKLTEFLPQYEKYGRAAPIVRNKEIVAYADMVLAFWDGCSPGTSFVIHYCEKAGKPCHIILLQ